MIVNYCPLAFMEESGRNLTPDKLAAAERRELEGICDRALRRQAEYYRPKWVIGVGGFAESRARAALAGTGISIGLVLHPSPASPAANRGWAGAATAQLKRMGLV